jgi:hypothetical protein
LLGKFTDRDLAEKLNRTLGVVRDRRKFLRKPAFGHASQPFHIEREPRDFVPFSVGVISGFGHDTVSWPVRLKRTLAVVRFRRSKKGITVWHGSCTA